MGGRAPPNPAGQCGFGGNAVVEGSGLEQLLNVGSETQVTLGCGGGDQEQGHRNDTGSYMCKAVYLRKQGLEYSLEDFIFPELVKVMDPQ